MRLTRDASGRRGRFTLLALAATVILTTVGAAIPQAASAATPKVSLSLSKSATTAGSSVKAKVAIHLPAGHHLAKASLSWGDGTAHAKITKLSVTKKHVFATPGTFHIVASVTDSKGKTTKIKKTVVVTVPSGSYSGDFFVGNSEGALSLYVPAAHNQIQDVSADASVTCSPGNATYGIPFVVDHLTMKAGGTFSGTTKRTGVFIGSKATFTVTFSGHVGGVTSTGQLKAAGSLIEKLTYNDGVAHACTSGKDSWSVTRDQQPTPQPTAKPLSGSYAGDYFVSGTEAPLSYYVAANRATIQDLSLDADYHCAPGSSSGGVELDVASIPVASNGSFSKTSTYTGVFAGSPATFTLVVNGHFHGTNAQGVQRAAGSLDATVTYNNGTSYTCTSDTVPFSATRDQQATPQPTSVTAGDYTGDYFSAGTEAPVTYTVSSDRKTIESVASDVDVRCSPGGAAGGADLVIGSIPLAADGSFSGTATSTGTFAGQPASFTFAFSGHAHGTSSTGQPRFAGAITATVAYNNGGAQTCSSDLLPWTATTS
jgi:hypothetical protein